LIPVDVVLVFALAAWICSRTRLRRWLTTRRRRQRQVRIAAEAVFVHDSVLHAPGKTGVLIYWSRLERQIDVVADVGILRAVPAEQWHKLVFALRSVPAKPHPVNALLEQIHEIGRLLTKHLPAADNHHSRFPKRLEVEQ
jgi:putative membrane protein